MAKIMFSRRLEENTIKQLKTLTKFYQKKFEHELPGTKVSDTDTLRIIVDKVYQQLEDEGYKL